MLSGANASRVFYRSFRFDLSEAVDAKGAYIIDAGGKRYLDASCGAAVSCLGHGDRRIIDAVKRQLEQMAFAHTSFFTNRPAEDLAECLSNKAPGGHWRVYFVSGGSEANEAALKLARQVQLERGAGSRDHYISRKNAYHGGTIMMNSIGQQRSAVDIYGAINMPKVRKIMPCFYYRWAEPGETPEAFSQRAAKALQTEIEQIGEDRVLAFIAETVSGATLGAVPPTPGYFKEIRRICDDTGSLMILDEVMAGMGRTGSLFACEQEGVVPDMITLAKGLGGGYQPIGALLVREEIAAEIERGSGAFDHGHTYVGHASACAAGLAVQRVFEEDDLISRCAEMGKKFDSALTAAFADHPHIGDIRGRGLFGGIELVKDKQTKQPFTPQNTLAARLKKRAMANGLICYPITGTIDGKSGDHIMLAPPFIITEAQIEELTDKLGRSINEAIAECTH